MRIGVGSAFILGLFVGIVGTFLITKLQPGVTEKINIPKCEPNWIYANLWVGEEQCKAICYNTYKVTSFKKDLNPDFNASACYCDINNCNPR